MTPFLTAKWLDLCLVTWRIPADVLRPYLPQGTEPDRRPGDPDDVAYVSYVAFRFLDTKVKGIKIPLHTDFPEVNLRAYVRETSGARRRGVTLRKIEQQLRVAQIFARQCAFHDVAIEYNRLRTACMLPDVRACSSPKPPASRRLEA